MKKIDMHCHILPGIDDGSANPKETLAMLRMALNQDFVGMIVTPHGSVRRISGLEFGFRFSPDRRLCTR